MTDEAPKDLPPCMWCGNDVTKELSASPSPTRERWFECGYCHRVFCVAFMPADPGSPGNAGET